MMHNLTAAISLYFTQPLRKTGLYYDRARLTYAKGGKAVYSDLLSTQPIGRDWELILFDRIGDDLCYAHVGYPNGAHYCHEILAFLRIEEGWKLVSALRAETAARYRSVCAQSQDEVDVLSELGRTLLTYSDAVYDLDAAAALAVFLPECRMIHPIDGKQFADVSCNVFYERWQGVPHPKTLGLPKYSRIYHIELLDESTAVAKIGMAKLNDHFNDYLFCVKTDGKWRITQKLTESVWKSPAAI